MKVHFKEKHKINTVKPFLIKRICRICDYDKSTSNDQLVKHITDEHPRSDYGDEDEGEELPAPVSGDSSGVVPEDGELSAKESKRHSNENDLNTLHLAAINDVEIVQQEPSTVNSELIESLELSSESEVQGCSKGQNPGGPVVNQQKK